MAICIRGTCGSMSIYRLRPRTSDLKPLAANSDGILLMNYDEHQVTSVPGPSPSQDWFIGNLQRVLKMVPKEKLICAIGNYGYDWAISIPDPKGRGSEAEGVDTEVLSVADVVAARLGCRRGSGSGLTTR